MRKLQFILFALVFLFASCQKDSFIDEENTTEVDDEETNDEVPEDGAAIDVSENVFMVSLYQDSTMLIKSTGAETSFEIQAEFSEYGIQDVCVLNFNGLCDGRRVSFSDENVSSSLLCIIDADGSGHLNGFVENKAGVKFYFIDQDFQYEIERITATSGSIDGNIWYDGDVNHVRMDLENGLNGLNVKLIRYSCEDVTEIIDVTYTGHKLGSPSDDGYYSFNSVESGASYYLEIVVPPLGLVPSNENIGPDESVDSDFDVETLRSQTVFLENGASLTFDLGLRPID